jgi:hypothetical protein
MKYGLLGLLLASGLTLPGWAAAEEQPTVVPVTKAPFHLFTFQDENMSLENVVLPAGRSTTYHSHNQDLFFVITDRFYALAVKDFDAKAGADAKLKALFEEGVAKLDAAARAAHGVPYVQVGLEEERVALLKRVETTPFFKTLRSGLVTGLYNQKEIWPLFGYEGSSADKGGYIERGFNDLTWL